MAIGLSGCGSASKQASAPANSSNSGDSGKDGGKAPAIVVPNDPVTLTFFVSAVKLTDAEFQDFFVTPLQKAHPNITLQKLDGKLDELIGGGTTPDIILTDNDWFQPIKKLGIPLDLDGLIKSFNFDLKPFVPEAITAIQHLDEQGHMKAVPFRMNAGAMFYNKDIFDKFGVPYPKDGMTWDDVLAASRKITRVESDGTNYVGWDPGFPDAVESPFSQPFVDPKTNKALIDTPIYKKVMEMIKKQYDMPGFLGPKSKYTYGPNSFMKDQNLAMITEWMIKMTGPLIDAYNAGTFQNWDMVTIPNFPENAGKGRHALTSLLLVSQTTKYKEQAMQVIQTVTSPENQLFMSKSDSIPVLTDTNITKQYGVNVPALKGKNTASIFKFKWSQTPPPNLNDKDVQPFIRALRKEIAVNKKDINSALREAQDAADKKLAELQATQ
jgi:multiple sugar transport system substrate-binding protein